MTNMFLRSSRTHDYSPISEWVQLCSKAEDAAICIAQKVYPHYYIIKFEVIVFQGAYLQTQIWFVQR